jgi:hypothetical protein
VLPPYAKNWETMSVDTAKRLLRLGHLAKVSEAPPPDLSTLPLVCRPDRSLRLCYAKQTSASAIDRPCSPIPIPDISRAGTAVSDGDANNKQLQTSFAAAHQHQLGYFSSSNTAPLESLEKDSFDCLLDEVDFSPFETNSEDAAGIQTIASDPLQRLLQQIECFSPPRHT